MFIDKLENKMLQTGCFVKNQYLDLYISLINKNLMTKKIVFVTQRHHIIPKCVSKFLNVEIDNTEQNLINLLYKDHILAHYYLCLCVDQRQAKLAYSLNNAFLHLIKGNSNSKQKIENFDLNLLDQYQIIYENWRRLNSELQKGRVGWNRGLTKDTDERVAKYSVPRHFSETHNINLGRSLKKYYQEHPEVLQGRKLSAATKAKISAAHKGKFFAPKDPVKRKQKLSFYSKKYWQEHPEKIVQLINYNRTRVLSPETHMKMRMAQKTSQKVLYYGINDELLAEFFSINEAIRQTQYKRYKLLHSSRDHRLPNGCYIVCCNENKE